MLQHHQGQIFDVSGGQYVTIYEVAELVAELTGATLERGSALGFTPTAREHSTVPGWIPEITLEAGITSLISRVKSSS
jgi:nucleoside-diphosphate-sugar epimerase